MAHAFRLALALILGAAGSAVVFAPVDASAKTHRAPVKVSKRKLAKKVNKKRKHARKLRRSARKLRRSGRKLHRSARKLHRPTRNRTVSRPNLPHPRSTALTRPAPANAYSVSPGDANLSVPKTEAIPLRVPGAPEEEKRVRLDMTKPYGAASPAATAAPARGIASEPPAGGAQAAPSVDAVVSPEKRD